MALGRKTFNDKEEGAEKVIKQWELNIIIFC